MAPPPGLNLAETELAERARGGDHDAIAELYRLHRAALYRHACRMLGDEAAAKDILQEAFARAIAAIGQTREQLHFKAWIFRIATNLCLRQLTQRLRVTPSDELAEAAAEPEPAEPIEGGLRREALARFLGAALEALPPRYRQIPILREVDELEYEELAEVLELSLSNVKVTLHRARARLRALFLAEQYRRMPQLARCEPLTRLLAAEERDPDSRAIERHLEACERCRREDRSARELFGLLPPLPGASPELGPAAPAAAPVSGAKLAGAAAGEGAFGGLATKLLGLAIAIGLGASLVTLLERPQPSPAPATTALASAGRLPGRAAPEPAPPTTVEPDPLAPASATAVPASRPVAGGARPPSTRPAAASLLDPRLAGSLRVKLELRAGTVRLERAGRLEPLLVGARLERGDRLRTEPGAWLAVRFPGDQWLALSGRLELSDASEHGEQALRRVEVRLLEGELRARATTRGRGMVLELGAPCRRGRCARCELDAGEARLRLLARAGGTQIRVEALAGYLQVRGPHAARMLSAGSALELGDRPGFSEPLLPAPRELRPVRASGPVPPLLRWDPVAGATGYRVRIGSEANLWLPEEDLLVREPQHRPRAGSPGRHFWQVIALSGDAEGSPSKIYAYLIEAR